MEKMNFGGYHIVGLYNFCPLKEIAQRSADVSLAFCGYASGEWRPDLRILTFHPNSCVFAPCS